VKRCVSVFGWLVGLFVCSFATVIFLCLSLVDNQFFTIEFCGYFIAVIHVLRMVQSLLQLTLILSAAKRQVDLQ
jgi:hypothetical protein